LDFFGVNVEETVNASQGYELGVVEVGSLFDAASKPKAPLDVRGLAPT
jgi:hypothetical protein